MTDNYTEKVLEELDKIMIGYANECKPKVKKILKKAIEGAKEEERKKMAQGLELWFSSHDRLQKDFMTNDLIKFLFNIEENK